MMMHHPHLLLMPLYSFCPFVPRFSVREENLGSIDRLQSMGSLLNSELTLVNDWKKTMFFEAESIEEVRKTIEFDISRPTRSNQ